jgi:hypothetical protein
LKISTTNNTPNRGQIDAKIPSKSQISSEKSYQKSEDDIKASDQSNLKIQTLRPNPSLDLSRNGSSAKGSSKNISSKRVKFSLLKEPSIEVMEAPRNKSKSMT